MNILASSLCRQIFQFVNCVVFIAVPFCINALIEFWWRYCSPVSFWPDLDYFGSRKDIQHLVMSSRYNIKGGKVFFLFNFVLHSSKQICYPNRYPSKIKLVSAIMYSPCISVSLLYNMRRNTLITNQSLYQLSLTGKSIELAPHSGIEPLARKCCLSYCASRFSVCDAHRTFVRLRFLTKTSAARDAYSSLPV